MRFPPIRRYAALERDGRRTLAPFDGEWFAGVLAALPVRSSQRVTRVLDWGDAPDTTYFVGRGEELELLRHWMIDERCRLLAVLGIGLLIARAVTSPPPGIDQTSRREAPRVHPARRLGRRSAGVA